MKKFTTLLLVLLTLTLTGCGNKKNVNDPDQLLKQLDREMARVDEYKADVDKLEEENAELLAEIDSLTANNNTLKQKLDAVTEESESSSSTDQQIITNLQKQVDDLKKQLEDAYNNKSTTSQIGNDSSAYQQTISSLNAQITDLKKQLQTASSSCTYPELQNQINVLTMDLQNYKQLVDTLQKQLADQIALNSKNSSTATSSYLTIKFWSDGFTYTANVKWYCDPNCTKSAGDSITISSPVVSQDKLSNGYTVYTCMSTNGLVYSSQYPYLSKNK